MKRCEECEWLLDTENNPQLIDSKDPGTQSYNHKDWETDNDLSKLRSGFFIKLPRTQLADTLTLTL